MKNSLIIICLIGMACNTTKHTAATSVSETVVFQDTIQEKFAIVDSIEKLVEAKKYPPVLVEFLEGPIEEAFIMAKKEKKNLFIDFTASWCAPCLQMDRETFSEKEVSDRLNSSFINVKLDDENFDGYTMKDRYNVSQLPTYLILSPNGKELYRIVGFKFWPRFLDEIKPY